MPEGPLVPLTGEQVRTLRALKELITKQHFGRLGRFSLGERFRVVQNSYGEVRVEFDHVIGGLFTQPMAVYVSPAGGCDWYERPASGRNFRRWKDAETITFSETGSNP